MQSLNNVTDKHCENICLSWKNSLLGSVVPAGEVISPQMAPQTETLKPIFHMVVNVLRLVANMSQVSLRYFHSIATLATSSQHVDDHMETRLNQNNYKQCYNKIIISKTEKLFSLLKARNSIIRRNVL